MRYLLPLLAFMALAVMLGLGLQRDPRALPSALIDRAVPAIDRPLLSDPQQRFDMGPMRGKVWLLNVWASWCEPCRAELPALKQLSALTGVPETFVIDATGRVRLRHAGPITAEVWRDKLMPVVRSLR